MAPTPECRKLYALIYQIWELFVSGSKWSELLEPHTLTPKKTVQQNDHPNDSYMHINNTGFCRIKRGMLKCLIVISFSSDHHL